MARETNNLRGVLKQAEPMSRHTSWRTGGSADVFYVPADIADLAEFIAQLPVDADVLFVGLGSNMLVRDGGLRENVVCLSGTLNNIEVMQDNMIRVEAGVACPKFARFSAKQNLTGAEFLCGIPGTMGGALAMNAGAMGRETWEIVDSVETLDRYGRLHIRKPDDYRISYRSVEGPADEWFVAATFILQPGEAESSLKNIKNYLARRSATQPTQQPNAGSVFRNPDGDYAARLIESCGLKGVCVGGACVSEKHANFIINTGTATASDIESLIIKVQDKVRDEFGISLIREVKILGEVL